MRRLPFLEAAMILLGCSCGGRTGLVVSEPPAEAGEPEGGPDADAGPTPGDATMEPDVTSLDSGEDDGSSGDAGGCAFGDVTGDVFGQTVYFAGGAALPAGRYRITYVDGCMKYSSSEDWSINAFALGDPAGSDHWWLVSGGQLVTSVIPPGTVGYLVGQGGYATFDECVQANLALPPIDVVLPSGPLGVWLQDDPYTDNVSGPNGRAPKWSLVCDP